MGEKITDTFVKKLKPPEKGNSITWDSEIHGFGVRITAAGAVSFILDYRFSKRQRRYTIGRWPVFSADLARNGNADGVKGAVQLLQDIRNKHDPMEERESLRTEPTMGDLLDDYLKSDELAKKRPNTLRDYKRMAEKKISPKLGKLRLKAIGRRDIEGLHAALKATPYQANRVLSLCSSIFTYAVSREWMDSNPVKGIQRYPEERRERFLDEDEIRRFTEALDSYRDQNSADALRLLLLTGSRMTEVLSAQWSEFDLRKGIWTKPSHHTKQKKVEHIPLSQPALDLLLKMKPTGAHGPLFAGREKKERATGDKKARVGIRRPWLAALKAVGLVEVTEVEGKRKGRDGKPRMVKRYKPLVRLHDLRHTFASHLASNGVSLQVIGKLIGHTQPSTTARYAHLQNEALRTATNQFGKIIKFQPRKKKTA